MTNAGLTADRTVVIPDRSFTLGDGGSGGGLAFVEDDTAPRLGGNLDVSTHWIVSSVNRNITIQPDGTGQIVLDGMKWPGADGTSGQVLTTDGSGNLTWGNPVASFLGLSDTPASYAGKAGKILAVKSDESGLEFVSDQVGTGGLTLPLGVSDGGTGATTAGNARINLGIGSLGEQSHNSVDINGGTIDGVAIGGTAAATSLTVSGTVSLNGNTFPTGTGTSGQVLTTNGAGTLTWAPASGGTSLALYKEITGGTVTANTVQGVRNVVIGNGQSITSAASDNSIFGGSLNSIEGGYYNLIVGGKSNTITSNNTSAIVGSDSVTVTNGGWVFGSASTTVSNYGIAIGSNAGSATSSRGVLLGADGGTISSSGVVLGGLYSSVASRHSVAMGFGGKPHASNTNAFVHGGDYNITSVINAGRMQAGQYLLTHTTTDGTQTALNQYGPTAGVVIGSETTWSFDINVVARSTDANNYSAAWNIKGCFARSTALGNVFVGTPTKTVIANDRSGIWDIDVQFLAASSLLQVKVTGEAARTINWLAVIRTAEIYA
ncbi:hypothetical protein [Azospirillum sp. sgz301742]